MIAEEVLTGGFSEPVFQSQTVFRKVLDAFARPGKVVEIPPLVRAPTPLYATTAAFLCTFADEGTPVCFEAVLNSAPALAWVTFHTGAPIASCPDTAHFAVIADSANLPPLETFALGTQEYPDRSTTIVIQVESLSEGTLLRLEGPGIDGAADVRILTMPEGLPADLAWNRGIFPRGVDIVLASPDAIVALPRSTRVTAPGHE